MRVHALHLAAAGVEVAHEGAGGGVGRGCLEPHDGLEDGWTRLLHAFAEGDATGHAEAELVGVDVVVGAVVKGDAEVGDGVAGEVAARSRFLNALFDGGDKVPGNGAAEDVVDELDARAAGERLHADMAIAELAVPPGLLLGAAPGLP